MPNRYSILLSAMIFGALAAYTPKAFPQPQMISAADDIQDRISKIGSEANLESRYELAKSLASYLRKDSSHVNESDVIALSSLLENPDDLTRHWVAIFSWLDRFSSEIGCADTQQSPIADCLCASR